MLKSHHISKESLDYFIEVDDRQQFISVHCSGILTTECAVKIIQDVLKYQAPDINYNRIYDLSDVQIDVAVSQYDFLLNESKLAFGSIGNSYKAAFVSDDPVTLQLISIFKVLSHKHAFQEIRYFKNTIQAIHWLSREDD